MSDKKPGGLNIDRNISFDISQSGLGANHPEATPKTTLRDRSKVTQKVDPAQRLQKEARAQRHIGSTFG